MSESPDRDISVLGPNPEDPDAQRPRPPRGSEKDDEANRAFAVDAARLLKELHCQDMLIFDVHGLSEITDYILIASGTSDRQISSVAGDVEVLGKERGLDRFGRDADSGNNWIVLDFVDVIVHLMEPSTRAHYDLEMMWGDAPRITWRQD
jgi:ribosome-associated protein